LLQQPQIEPTVERRESKKDRALADIRMGKKELLLGRVSPPCVVLIGAKKREGRRTPSAGCRGTPFYAQVYAKRERETRRPSQVRVRGARLVVEERGKTFCRSSREKCLRAALREGSHLLKHWRRRGKKGGAALVFLVTEGKRGRTLALPFRAGKGRRARAPSSSIVGKEKNHAIH